MCNVGNTVCPKSPDTPLRASSLRSNNIKSVYHGITYFTYIDAVLVHSIVSKNYLKILISYPFFNFKIPSLGAASFNLIQVLLA